MKSDTGAQGLPLRNVVYDISFFPFLFGHELFRNSAGVTVPCITNRTGWA